MADSKINAFTPLSFFSILAGTQTFIRIRTKAELDAWISDSDHLKQAIFFSVWDDISDIPETYGSGILFPCVDAASRKLIYVTRSNLYYGGTRYDGSTVTYYWNKVTATSV